MIFLFLGLVATAGLAAFVMDDTDDGDIASEDGLDECDALTIDENGVAHGTEFDDRVGYDQLVAVGALGIAGATIDLGGGDDFVDAVPPGGLNSDLEVELNIDLGEGDDTVVGPLFASNLSGGAGDDWFEVVETHGEILTIDGGEGNDTIDARTSDNATLIGGAGDDVIHSMGRPPAGTGYVTNVDGGQGNDTLHVYADSAFEAGGLNPLGEILGGSGTDHFVVHIDDEVYYLADLDQPYPAPWADLENEDGTGWRCNVVSLADFDPSAETLELHLSSPNEDYEVGAVQIVADGVVVTYESAEHSDLEMLIACDTTGLAVDQISVVGADPVISIAV